MVRNDGHEHRQSRLISSLFRMHDLVTEEEDDDVMLTPIDADMRDPHVSDCEGKKREGRGLGLCWALAGLTWLVSALFYFFALRLFFLFLAQQKQHQNIIQTQMFSK